MEGRTTWRLGAAVLILALAANLYSHNRLWAGYTLVGMVGYTVLLWLDRTGRLRIPAGNLLALFVLGAMHFLGGSLAGLHSAFGVNGAYYVFPWWDNLAHAFGGAIVWMIADVYLRDRLQIDRRNLATTLACVGIAALAGVGIELYEFTGFVVFGTVDQGFYTNTMLDLYYDLLGAVAVAVGYHVFGTAASRTGKGDNADGHDDPDGTGGPLVAG